MIDAATFANLYNAFWRAAAPTCDLFVRRINLGELDRFDAPMTSTAIGQRPALIAETGFSAFVLTTDRPELKRNPIELLQLAADESRDRLRPFQSTGLELDQALSPAEQKDATQIAERLSIFFQLRRLRTICRPKFAGCGFVDNSEGDVISGKTLFEVKSVDRGFRSADIHQLVTYYCLSISASEDRITSLGLINPRRGVSFEMDADRLCQEISGTSASELSNEVILALSSGGISR